MALFDKLKNQVKGQIRDALDSAAREIDPEPQLTQERALPKKDIYSTQTFTQSKSFKGFRREKLSTFGLDGVELNHKYFREQYNDDFTNSAIQLMVVKARNDEGKCVRVVVDGRFMGNLYRSERTAESFDMIVAKKIDKAHFRVETAYYADGSLMGYNTYIMVHWPGIGPRVTIK